MSLQLNRVKEGIIKALGRGFSARTGPTLKELEERRKQQAEIDSLIAEFEAVIQGFHEITIMTAAATQALQALNVNTKCKICSCESIHHNPDKRTKTGFGKCICGHCYKYRPMALITINSAQISDVTLLNPLNVKNGDTISISYTIALK